MIGRNLNFAQARKLAFYDVSEGDASRQWQMMVARGFIRDVGNANKFAITQAGQDLLHTGLSEAYQNGSNATGDHADDEQQQNGMQAAPAPAPGAHIQTPSNPPAAPAATPAAAAPQPPTSAAPSTPQQPAQAKPPVPPQPVAPSAPATPPMPAQAEQPAPNTSPADLNTAKTIAAKLKSQPNYNANNIDADVANEMKAKGTPQNAQAMSGLVRQQMGVQESRNKKSRK